MYLQYIEDNHMRHTHERLTILRHICDFKIGFFPNDICTISEKDFISKATVYNALKLFVKAGILTCLRNQSDNKRVRYELTVGKKSHLQAICRKCGRIIELKDNMLETALLTRKIANFKPDNFSLYIYGECKKCRRVGK